MVSQEALKANWLTSFVNPCGEEPASEGFYILVTCNMPALESSGVGAEFTMIDPYQVLQQKELDVSRLRKEIEALHSVIPLLVEDGDWAEHGLAVAPSISQLSGTGTTV
jgi:hypothetical protein